MQGYETTWVAFQDVGVDRGRFAATIRRLKRDRETGKVLPPAEQEDIGFISERDLPVDVNLQLMQVTIRGEHYN